MKTNREREQNDDERAGLFARGDRHEAVPLLGVEIRAEVVAGHARAVVRQRYRNDETRPIEAVYTFPLPTRGSVTGFAMSMNGRQLVGEVHEREDAFRRYDDAISAGHVAALLAALAAAPKVDPKLAELALAALWLLSTGRRTRVAIKDATTARPGLEDLAAVLGRDEDVRAHVERIAPLC
jgi:hypothetical protein